MPSMLQHMLKCRYRGDNVLYNLWKAGAGGAFLALRFIYGVSLVPLWSSRVCFWKFWFLFHSVKVLWHFLHESTISLHSVTCFTISALRKTTHHLTFQIYHPFCACNKPENAGESWMWKVQFMLFWKHLFKTTWMIKKKKTKLGRAKITECFCALFEPTIENWTD